MTGSSYRAGKFRLGERSADLVESPANAPRWRDLNHILLGIPGVQDGVFFMGERDGARVARLLALVVAPGLRKAAFAGVAPAHRRRFSAAPAGLVDALPRNALGKLPRDMLLHLARQGKAKCWQIRALFCRRPRNRSGIFRATR